MLSVSKFDPSINVTGKLRRGTFCGKHTSTNQNNSSSILYKLHEYNAYQSYKSRNIRSRYQQQSCIDITRFEDDLEAKNFQLILEMADDLLEGNPS